MLSIESRLAAELAVKPQQVAAAVALLDAGSTVPFIARYRKEATEGLDDAQLRALEERLGYLRELEEHRGAGQTHRRAECGHCRRRHEAAPRGLVPAVQAEASHEGNDCSRSRAR